MRRIDLDQSPRKDHFNFFRTWDYPHFNMCANVDITDFLPDLKHRGVSFTIGWIYLITRAANAIPEFRYRIHGEEMVEHEVVHPACTIMRENDLFSFCYFTYTENFGEFAETAKADIEAVKKSPCLENKALDNWLYMTAIPWVSFTSFMHPLQLSPADSIPRFAWGKFFRQGNRILLPFSVQGHHAVMDGLHMGRYYEQVQALADTPGKFL